MNQSLKYMLLIVAQAMLFAMNACAQAYKSADWPFITIRQTHTINYHPEVLERLAAINEAHPGSADEYWLSDASRKRISEVEKDAEAIAHAAEICRRHGIRAGFQQGRSLGHSATGDETDALGVLNEPFPDDAWQLDSEGRRLKMLCPRSPDVLAWEEQYVKTILGRSHVESWWIDDDLRLGLFKPYACFCDRCVAAYNDKYGADFTRAELAKHVYGAKTQDSIRAKWIAVKEEGLALYAAAARRGVDAVSPMCRLAYQAVWSDTICTGRDYRRLLEGMSGPDRRQTGIRPGAGVYNEYRMRDIVAKCLSVAREAERCRTYGGLVGTVAYEMETYPRRVVHKSPEAVMIESMLALASGCDALTLYWFGMENPEPLSYYDEFATEVAAWRPYLERVAELTRRTRLGGAARFIGSAAAETAPGDLRDETEAELAMMGIPITVAEAKPQAFYVNEKSDAEMIEADRASDTVKKAVRVPAFSHFMTVAERDAFLDALDNASMEGLPVRLEKMHAIRILPRITEKDRTAGVSLLNLSIGRAQGIRLRIRRPAGMKVLWLRPRERDVELIAEKTHGFDEITVTIPTLPGWQPGTVLVTER